MRIKSTDRLVENARHHRGLDVDPADGRSSGRGGVSTADRPAPPPSSAASDAGTHVAPTRSPAAAAAAFALDLLGKYGAFIAFAITVLVFSIVNGEEFWGWGNWKDMLAGAAVPAIVAFGLTIVLTMNDFDLSFGATIGFGGSMAVILVSEHGTPWPVALLAAIGIGVAVGVVNGVLVAYAGGPSFIITLATATVIGGLEISQTHSQTIYQGIPTSFTQLGQGVLWGLKYPVYIALGVGLVLWGLLTQTEWGRYMTAVGGNPEAARLTGLRTRALRLAGFVIAGAAAALAGVLLQAAAASSYPNSGTGYLLRVFAAVFLGAAMSPNNRFNIPGTLVGVVFLQVIDVGLIQLNLEDWVPDVVSGSVLVFAVLLSRLGRRTAVT
jgi:ribose transport system permease protein